MTDVCQGWETKMVRQLFIWSCDKERRWKLSFLRSQLQVHLMGDAISSALMYSIRSHPKHSSNDPGGSLCPTATRYWLNLFFRWCIFMKGHGKLPVTAPKSKFQLYCVIILLWCQVTAFQAWFAWGPRWYHEWQNNECMVTLCVSKACLQAADYGSYWGREGAQSVLLSCKTTEEPGKKNGYPKSIPNISQGHDLGIWLVWGAAQWHLSSNIFCSSLTDSKLPGLVVVLHQPPQPASVACFHVLSPSMLRCPTK